MIYSDLQWNQLPLKDLNGILMIVGDSDTGKTTFAKYLFKKLTIENPDKTIFFLDGDPGQSSIGPPTTITLSNNLVNKNPKYQQNFIRRYFIGSISPRGHMLQMIIGLSKLIGGIPNFEKSIIIHDTSGLVEPGLGGFALKSAMIDLLQPSTLFVIQREDELTNLILPYKVSGRVELIELSISGLVTRKDRENRKNYRRRLYQEYFSKAHQFEFACDRFATFPFHDFRLHKLIAFEDKNGFAIGIGIINSIDRKSSSINVVSSIPTLEKVNALKIGDVSLNPDTFFDSMVIKHI